MCQHEWDGAVESHLVVQVILKHVQVVEPIGVAITGCVERRLDSRGGRRRREKEREGGRVGERERGEGRREGGREGVSEGGEGRREGADRREMYRYM